MKTARPIFISLTIMVAAALTLPVSVRAAAGSLQICEPGGTCKIGEFLYDDEYVPITTASCTITSKYPDGTALHTSQAMSGATDGFYSYSFTAPSTTGAYRAQVCCTSGTDYLCLDKSFEVKTTEVPSSNDIASAVWGYSSRTLSGFGNLISDIWNYSTRSLTSLVTGTTNITTNITNIEKATDDTRLLLEKLVNAPIIENSLDEEEDPDLGAKIKDTKGVANQLYINSQYVSSKSRTLSAKWKTYTASEANKNVDEISTLLGSGSDEPSESTIFGEINWLKQGWDFPVLTDISKQASKVKSIVASLERKAVYSKTKPTSTEVNNLALEIARLEKSIGSVTDGSEESTLYGKIKEVEELASALDSKSGEIDKTLASWNGIKPDEKQTKVKGFLKAVLGLNSLPKIKNVLSPNLGIATEDKELKNSLFGMRGVLAANKKYLAKKAGKTIGVSWLELGSIVFKSLVTNLSTLISQTAKVKYYLPKEVREENVIEKDGGLEIKYDAEKDQYYVEGEVTLAVGESKVLSVKVHDIWALSAEEIESKKNQAAELFKSLEKTSFFAQGVTLKSDIDASLDKAKAYQEAAYTPEEQIRAYREAQIEMAAVDQKMSKLEDLVVQAGSAGSLLGFVGGAQAIAVWGLIIILIAGFVFLAVYMRTISGRKGQTKDKKVQKTPPVKTAPVIRPRFAFGTFIVVFLTALISSSASAIITWRVLASTSEKKEAQAPLDTAVLSDSTSQEATEQPRPETKEEAAGGEDTVRVDVPEGSSVNVRQEASASSKVIARLSFTRTVTRLGEEADWVNVAFALEDPSESSTEGQEGEVTGWVHSDFIVEPEEETEEASEDILPQEGASVVISETPTGWLRVRANPWGAEVGRVTPGESFPLLDEKDGWFLIEISDEQSGWVTSEYASVE